MRQHCGLTSIRCHFEWRHSPSPFPFSFHKHTLSSLLPHQMTYCSGTVLQMRLLWPSPFPLDERDMAVGWRALDRRGEEVKGEGWHIPQPDHVTTSAREKNGHITLLLCIFRIGALSFSFLRRMKMEKIMWPHLRCDEHNGC